MRLAMPTTASKTVRWQAARGDDAVELKGRGALPGACGRVMRADLRRSPGSGEHQVAVKAEEVPLIGVELPHVPRNLDGPRSEHLGLECVADQ